MPNILTRYETFCQLKELVKSGAPVLLTGIDVGKQQHTACVRLGGQWLMKNLTFANTKAGYEKLWTQLEAIKQRTGVRYRLWGLESTGNYHKPLAYFLQTSGELVVLVSTLAVRRNRETLNVSWDKSDRKDAENITDLMGQGKFFYYNSYEDLYGDLRRLVGHYRYVKEEAKKIQIKLRNDILSLVFPELDGLFASMSSPWLGRLLRTLPFPAQIRRLSEPEFIQRLAATGVRYQKKLKQVYQAAQVSVGIEVEKESLQTELNYLLDRYEVLTAAIDHVQKKLTARLQGQARYQNLQTIPGVGPVIAAIILSEVGDISRYDHARQLVKLAGLDIARYQSGKYCSPGNVSKRGRPLLRSRGGTSGLGGGAARPGV